MNMIDEPLQFQARLAGAVQPGKVMLVGAGPVRPTCSPCARRGS